MFVIPIHTFLGLTELLPHQELRRRGMLVEREKSMATVIFVSHQWTSFDHPDHTGRQLRTLQRMFERMLTSQVPEVDAPFSDQAAFKGKVKVAPREWKNTLRDAYIWVDFAGVPQKETANDAAAGSDGRCAIARTIIESFGGLWRRARTLRRSNSYTYFVLHIQV